MVYTKYFTQKRYTSSTWPHGHKQGLSKICLERYIWRLTSGGCELCCEPPCCHSQLAGLLWCSAAVSLRSRYGACLPSKFSSNVSWRSFRTRERPQQISSEVPSSGFRNSEQVLALEAVLKAFEMLSLVCGELDSTPLSPQAPMLQQQMHCGKSQELPQNPAFRMFCSVDADGIFLKFLVETEAPVFKARWEFRCPQFWRWCIYIYIYYHPVLTDFCKLGDVTL